MPFVGDLQSLIAISALFVHIPDPMLVELGVVENPENVGFYSGVIVCDDSQIHSRHDADPFHSVVLGICVQLHELNNKCGA